MTRMISGVCVLGLLVGTYFVCPKALQARVNAALSPSPEVLEEVRAGIDAITRPFARPGDLNPGERA